MHSLPGTGLAARVQLPLGSRLIFIVCSYIHFSVYNMEKENWAHSVIHPVVMNPREADRVEKKITDTSQAVLPSLQPVHCKRRAGPNGHGEFVPRRGEENSFAMAHEPTPSSRKRLMLGTGLLLLHVPLRFSECFFNELTHNRRRAGFVTSWTQPHDLSKCICHLPPQTLTRPSPGAMSITAAYMS